jgi:hypothetical protein
VNLPPPLVPANVDLRSMPEMPLEVALFKDASVIVSITDAAFKAAVLLWAASWHQIPASSLPDDDKILSMIAGYGREVSCWLEVKEQALWKFIKCSDGRWYHPKIAEKAIRTWEYRESYRRRMEAARNAKADKNHKPKTRNGRSVTDAKTRSIKVSVSALNQTKPNCILDRSTSLAKPLGQLSVEALSKWQSEGTQ